MIHKNPIPAVVRRFIAAGLSGFDAVYPALAEEIGGWWITFDSKAQRRIEEEQMVGKIIRGVKAKTGKNGACS